MAAIGADPLELAHRATPVLLDGALGTELERRGVDTASTLWSAAALDTAPAVVEQIHRDYVAAGADVLVANTFRANPRTLHHPGRLADGPELCRRAVAFARAAATERTVVAASVGPAADCYRPELTPSHAELRDEHVRLATWLRDARPDLLWIETIATVREARAASDAARGARLPFTVSFITREDGRLLGGESLESAVAAISDHGPLAIGLNCIPPDGATAALQHLRRLTALPIAVYAHIGNVRPLPGWSYAQRDVTPARYAAYAAGWRDLGANIIGGCCGTTPAHVRALANLWGPA